MVIIYYFFALAIFLVGLFPLFFAIFFPKYRISIPARFFCFNNPKFQSQDIHFHVCSFGEVRSIAPLVKALGDIGRDVAISVITKTGFDEATKITKNRRFLPFEIFLPFWLKPSKILVIFEAELWLMLIFMAKIRGSRVILINARISDRSFKRYLKFVFLYRYLFKFVDQIYAQSEIDKRRLEILGGSNIKVVGNIKSAFLPSVNKIYNKPKERVIVIASSHYGEEKMILCNLNLQENDKLIVVPRHPERFDEVSEIIQAYAKMYNFSFSKFSKSRNFEAKCILVDVMGELVNIYAISDIVILGGSFVPNVGGHNPIEAAQFNNTIISGEFVFNQKTLYSAVSGIQFAKIDEINKLLKEDLDKAKIISKGDVSEILKDIKDSYERG